MPAAHEKAASSSNAASVADRPPPLVFPATSSATPRNAANRASAVRDEGRPDPRKPQASSGTNSGMVARQSAETPDGTNCSSRASTAWQPTNRNSPTAPEPSHSAGRGHAESGSRRRDRPSRMPPPTRQRAAIIGNGGIVSTAQAMARKVEPQTR